MNDVHEQLKAVSTSLSGPGRNLPAPRPLVFAVASAIGASEIQHAVVAKEAGNAEGGTPQTRWRYAALTSSGIVAGAAVAEIHDWELNDFAEDTSEPQIDIAFIPLREVTYCSVVGIEVLDFEEWTARWEIGLRGREPIRLPVGRNSAERAAASALGRAIADRL